jgi:hypothetical protein
MTGEGKQSAVESESGQPVANSGPVLRRPTSSATSGRKPGACPLHSAQSWPGCGAGSPAERACREAHALLLGRADLVQLIVLFELLDAWDRKESRAEAM